ncbi:hypothetical protein Moror_5613 [Moniliophthora roreri MCA 2997]|uniref:Uncharacterized protein n=1 Tax=Moniliophthora roreri (strain MCA 2997) TaxID=1381753 RepID=V2WMS8_MONRO|nr:hypothetical protein Moror_5613 [Moniliophthora roreri MCA 2997]
MPHLPAEIIEIIVGFATDVTVVQGYQHRHYMEPYFQRLRKCEILHTLSLVSRNWLPACRRGHFKRNDVVFDVQESQNISDFLDILRGRDQLPNLPHILSFFVTITLNTPIACAGSIARYPEEVFNFLDELAQRKEFFRPRTLCIYDNLVKLPDQGGICHRSDLISAIAKTFPTITEFHFGTNVFDGFYTNFDHLVFFFKEIQELDVRCWSISSSPNDDGNLHTYRFPEGLRALQYSDPFFIPSDNLESTLSWLQSHPPLRQMRRLSFVKAVPSSRAVIQGFINICPNLDTFYLSCWNGDKTHETTGVIDLSHNKDLNRLCFYIPGFGNTNSDFSVREEALLNTILLTVRTATSLRGSLEFLVDASYFCERAISWWYSLGEAISALPQDVLVKIRMDYGSGFLFGRAKGESIIRRGFRNLLKHRRFLFSTEGRDGWLYKPRGWDDFEEVADQYTWKTIAIEDE